MPECAPAHSRPAKDVWIPAPRLRGERLLGNDSRTPGMSFPRRRESIGFRALFRMSSFTGQGCAPARTRGQRPGNETVPHA